MIGLLPGSFIEIARVGDVLRAFNMSQAEYEDDIRHIMKNCVVLMMEAHEIFKERMNFLIVMYKRRGLAESDAIRRARESKEVLWFGPN